MTAPRLYRVLLPVLLAPLMLALSASPYRAVGAGPLHALNISLAALSPSPSIASSFYSMMLPVGAMSAGRSIASSFYMIVFNVTNIPSAPSLASSFYSMSLNLTPMRSGLGVASSLYSIALSMSSLGVSRGIASSLYTLVLSFGEFRMQVVKVEIGPLEGCSGHACIGLWQNLTVSFNASASDVYAMVVTGYSGGQAVFNATVYPIEGFNHSLGGQRDTTWYR